jgi:hypothetical protein
MDVCVVWQAWLAPVLVSALCGSCQPLVGRTESPNDLLQKPRGPDADVGSLVDGVRVLRTLGLLPTHWQVTLSPGVSARLLAGTAGSWHLVAVLRDPRAHFRSLMVE